MKPSLRKAINNKCKECIYCNQGPGSWRQQVAACTAITCPLFAVRPMPGQSIGTSVNALENSEMDRIGAVAHGEA